MKKQITLNGFIYASKPETYEADSGSVVEGVKYTFSTYGGLSTPFFKVSAISLTFETESDMRNEFVKELLQKKEAVAANYQNQITEINRQIQELLALPNEA